MSEEEPTVVSNFDDIPIELTPEQQEELQKKMNLAYKEFVAGLPDTLLVIGEETQMTKFSVRPPKKDEKK